MPPTIDVGELENRLDSVTGHEKIDLLIKIARELYFSEPEKSKKTVEQAYNLSEETNYRFGIAESLRVLGNIAWVQSNYDLAMTNYLHSRKIFEQLGNSDRLTLVYKALGRTYHNLDDPGNSLRYFHLALETAENDNHNANIATCCNGLGFAYHHYKKYEKALNYFQKGLVITEATGDKYGTAMAYNNIADICLKISDCDRAMEFAIKGINILDEIGCNAEGFVSEFNITIGDAFFAKGNYEKASKHYHIALKIATEVDYTEGFILTITKLAALNLELKQFEKAEMHINEALEMAKLSGNLTVKKQCLKLLDKLQKQQMKHQKPDSFQIQT